MAYIPISKRNLQFFKCTFLSAKIKVSKLVREDRIERFRIDMLYKYDLYGKKTPHLLKVEHN